MTKTPSHPSIQRPAAPLDTGPRDWFVAAIECNGTVSDCLSAVLGELHSRAGFIQSLMASLESNGVRGVDAVTDLSQKIKGLENTLKFRLGILRPERPQAWFRAPAATSTGPFSATLIDEPVFASFDPWDADKVKRELYALWTARRAKGLPFKDDGGCLWKTLLTFNADYKRLVDLPAPFHAFTLETLPDTLPVHLDSRALRAFLLNVRNEVRGARERLDLCFRQLREASERFWAFQLEHGATEPSPQRPFGHTGASQHRGPSNPQADSMREEFKRRREKTHQSQSQGARAILSGNDLDALRFLGFEDYPALEALRQRYLQLAKQYHPDRNGGNESAFKRLSSAYAHLMSRIEVSVK